MAPRGRATQQSQDTRKINVSSKATSSLFSIKMSVIVMFVCLGQMETRPWFNVSSDRLVEPGIERTTPGLQGEQFIHYTTAGPIKMIAKLE